MADVSVGSRSSEMSGEVFQIGKDKGRHRPVCRPAQVEIGVGNLIRHRGREIKSEGSAQFFSPARFEKVLRADGPDQSYRHLNRGWHEPVRPDESIPETPEGETGDGERREPAVARTVAGKGRKRARPRGASAQWLKQ